MAVANLRESDMSFAAGLRQALDLRQTDVVSELRHGDSLEEILSKHLLTVERMSDREIFTSVLLLSVDGKYLTTGAAPSLPASYCEAINGLAIGPAAGSCGTAAFSGRPVYVTDIANDPLWAPYKELALPHGLRSCWSTPIRNTDGKILGTFAIYNRTLSGPTREELHAIDLITENVAKAIIEARRPTMTISEMLPRQVAALQALATAISQQASTLDPKGQEAVDAIVAGTRTLAELVQQQLAGAQALN
jgi:GAF domain-containing protein